MNTRRDVHVIARKISYTKISYDKFRYLLVVTFLFLTIFREDVIN